MGFINKLLKSPFIYRVFIWVLQRFPRFIFNRSLIETPDLLAFFHPKPAHAFHIVLLPRTAMRSFTEIDPGDPFVSDLINSVKQLVDRYDLLAYRLVVNGGAYQEFPHLHFHLISDVQKE
jgi:diadenosine tetraphosphate (Ap4A) HIT family hydrolase